MCSGIPDQTAESEYVGCSRDCGPGVPCQIGSRVSRKGFGFERGKGRDLNNELLCWPPRIPPCQTFSPMPCYQDARFQGHSKTEVTRLGDRKPLVRRCLEEDLFRRGRGYRHGELRAVQAGPSYATRGGRPSQDPHCVDGTQARLPPCP